MFLFNGDKIKTFILNKKIFFKNKSYMIDNQKEKNVLDIYFSYKKNINIITK